MKRTKTLFLLFIFVLSFLQQQQAVNAQSLPSVDNLSSDHSPQAIGLASTVIVYMRHINNDGVIVGTGVDSYCKLDDDWTTGCVEQGSGLTYPPVSQYVTPKTPNTVNPLVVDVDHYYLQNVLPREMDVATYDPPLAALKAQALAARSIADWKADKYWIADEFNSIDNSTNFQVFKPGSFDAYHVADEAKANEIKNRIDQAILETSGQYLFYPNDQGKLSLDAEFSNDIGNPTVPGDWTEYLKSVQEPISPSCDLSPLETRGNGWGMSQKGAMRWAKGNQCAGSGDQPWPVKWDGENGYKQILTHYYTGIDILDGNGVPIAPDNRWNLLWHNNFGNPVGTKPELQSSLSYTLEMIFQNTSVDLWTPNSYEIGYRWYQNGQPIDQWHIISANLPELAAGGEYPPIPADPLTVANILPPDYEGNYTLHLDLYRNGHWFSEQEYPWPDATIDIHVNGPTATPTFTPAPPTPIPPTSTIATSTSTPTIQPTLSTSRIVFVSKSESNGGTITCSEYFNGQKCSFDIPASGSNLFHSVQAQFDWSGSPSTVYFVIDANATGTFGYYGPAIDINGWGYFIPGGYWSTGTAPATGLGFRQWTGSTEEWKYTFDPYILIEAHGGTQVGTSGNFSGEFYVMPQPVLPTPTPCECPSVQIFGRCYGSFSFPGMGESLQEGDDILNLLYQVENEVLSQTSAGQRYIDLYDTNGREISMILATSPELTEEAIALLQLWEANLQALVDGQGDTVSISQEEVDAIDHFLAGVAVAGSNDLKTTIQNERAALNMQGLVGQTMEQAWEEINDPATATPTNTPANAPTFTPTATQSATQTATQTPTSTPTNTAAPTVTQTPSGAQIDTFVGGVQQGSHFVGNNTSQRQSYAAVNTGPVKIISTNNVPVIDSEKTIYKTAGGVDTSYSEMMGLPNGLLDTIYWMPWYNNVDYDTQLRLANTSGSTATVHVYIAGVEMTGSPFTLASGTSTRQGFTGINNGPVKIVSNVPIVAAARVIYSVNGVQTSYSEMMALPNSQLNTTFWMPWYNSVDLDSQLRFANASGSTATVHVYIGGVEMTGSPFTLAPGASTRQSFAGINAGLVKLVSNVNLVAAQRVIYKVNGVDVSYSEMMGLPNSQLNTTYWFPSYNNVDLDSQVRIANLSSSTATVHVYVGGVEMTSGCTPSNSPILLAAGASIRLSCSGVNSGPAKIVSTGNIVAAERFIYNVSGTATSYSEMMGLPNSLLDTTYWMPWYNNVDMNMELILGVGGSTGSGDEGFTGLSSESSEVSEVVSTFESGSAIDPFDVTVEDGSPFWQGLTLGAEQDVVVTFTNVHTPVGEQHSNGMWSEDSIQVLYDTPGSRIQLWAYTAATGWTQRGEDIPVTFADGDVFRARALADGTVEILRNGTLLVRHGLTARQAPEQDRFARVVLFFPPPTSARRGFVTPPIRDRRSPSLSTLSIIRLNTRRIFIYQA